jgi:regulator of replication initiation timing
MVKSGNGNLEKARRNVRSPEELLEAAANLERHFAELSAQAAELPALRAENERLRGEKERLDEKLQSFVTNVALLAAQISPEAFNGSRDDMRAAIRLAQKRLRDTRSILNEIADEDEANAKKRRAEAAKRNLSEVYKGGFERIVKLITNQKSWDRALDKFKRYVAAKKVTDGSDVAKVLEGFRRQWEEHGCTLQTIAREIREFGPWWKQEKGRQARESAQAKIKKPGHVKRPKSDLRKKENRRHKQGYCQVCGKPTRRRKIGKRWRYERKCDKHLTAKPLIHSVGDLTDAPESSLSGDPRQHGPIPV